MTFFQEDIRDFRLSKSLVPKYFLQAILLVRLRLLDRLPVENSSAL